MRGEPPRPGISKIGTASFMHRSGSKRLMKIAAWRQTQLKTAVLVPTFRSSYSISAITYYELRKAMGTSKFMILVPLFDLKSLGSFRRLRCWDFKSAALAYAQKIALADFHAVVAQNAVRDGGVEIEIRKRKVAEELLALQRQGIVWPGWEADVAALGAIELRWFECLDVLRGFDEPLL